MTLTLSKRLYKIATFLPKGAYFADIGTDHAYLPCYVCLNDITAHAIAGEVSIGPFKRAKETVAKYALTNKVDVRLGNGLQIINEKVDPIEQLVIAGMGGSLMKDILNNGLSKLSSVQRIILQPNVGAHFVREWLYEQNYAVAAETIVEENDHLYEIIVADYGLAQPYSCDKKLKAQQIMFGPLLMKDKSVLFRKKWLNELEHLQRVVNEMKHAQQSKARRDLFREHVHWIEEVLGDG